MKREPLDRALRYACLVLAVGIWVPGLRLLSRIWQESDFFAHGYFIPVVTPSGTLPSLLEKWD